MPLDLGPLLRRLAHGAALLGAGVGLVVAGMTAASIVGRALWSKPLQGDVELTQFGVALCISLCLPWCQIRGANILVDFFTVRLPERAIRRLDGVGAWLLGAMCVLLAWRTSVGAVSVREAMETSMILGLPMWWVYAALAPGFALTAAIAFVQGWRHLRLQPLDDLLGEERAR